jgi:integrase
MGFGSHGHADRAHHQRSGGQDAEADLANSEQAWRETEIPNQFSLGVWRCARLLFRSQSAVYKNVLEHRLGHVASEERPHHNALGYDQIGIFMYQLQKRAGHTARCLELITLLAMRSQEARQLTWAEVDLASQTITLQPGCMKSRKLMRWPLSAQAVALLHAQQATRVPGEVYVFPGRSAASPVQESAIGALLRRMHYGDKTTCHGLRATFRTWAAEQCSEPREVVESCLAHAVAGATELSYMRSDFFHKRLRVMQQWADHCSTIQRRAVVAPD